MAGGSGYRFDSLENRAHVIFALWQRLLSHVRQAVWTSWRKRPMLMLFPVIP